MKSFLLLSTLELSLGGLVFLLGFIILRENPSHRLNRTVALMLFFGGLGAVLAALSFMSTRTVSTATVPGSANLLESVSYLWEFFFPALFLFASIFPRERAFTHRLPALMGRWWTPGFGMPVFGPLFPLRARWCCWCGSRVPLPRVGCYATSHRWRAWRRSSRLFLLVHQSLFSLVNLGFGLAASDLFDSWRRATVPRLKRQLGVIAVGRARAAATALRPRSRSSEPQLTQGCAPAHDSASRSAGLDRICHRAPQVPRRACSRAAASSMRSLPPRSSASTKRAPAAQQDAGRVPGRRARLQPVFR
jgi:hypothetical protein